MHTSSTPTSPIVPGYVDVSGGEAILQSSTDSTPKRESHRFYLEDGNLELELDDGTLYNVHRYFFKKYAPAFGELYLDGATEKPVRVPKVASLDLDRYFEPGSCDICTVEEWTSILRLATAWSVPSLRQLAIRKIEPKATPVDKIVIAREFDLGEKWLLPAFTDICSAPHWLDYEDAQRLDMRTVVELARIREGSRAAARGTLDVEMAVGASNVLFPNGDPFSRADDTASSSAASLRTSPSPSSSPDLSAHETATATPSSANGPIPLWDSTLPALQGQRIPTPDELQPLSPPQRLGLVESLALLTLQNAELAEEAKAWDSPLDRVQFALRLETRIATETSLVALYHRAWRQRRVAQIFSGLAMNTAETQNRTLLADDYGFDHASVVSAVLIHLARIVVANHLARMPQQNHGSATDARERIRVITESGSYKYVSRKLMQ
ncbi:hypothetical protein EV122DRAFT_210872 [Schizophyllum commune]